MEPKIVEDKAEEFSYVVKGAMISCSDGDAPGKAIMPGSHGVFLKGKAQLNVNDFKPVINITPFGMCSNLANPAVASATAANMGVLTPMPCMPVVTMPWTDGKEDNLVEGQPAMLSTCKNYCIYGGEIIIEDDGQ